MEVEAIAQAVVVPAVVVPVVPLTVAPQEQILILVIHPLVLAIPTHLPLLLHILLHLQPPQSKQLNTLADLFKMAPKLSSID